MVTLIDNRAAGSSPGRGPATAGPAQEPLYAARRKIFPKAVKGRFRRLKWIIMVVTLGIYYLLPWLRWDRGPFAPDQAVLLDLANQRFYFFFIEIWPQEFYYVAGLLVMAGVGLFLSNSTIGRAWCGYACPQTVWVDLFVHVERLIEGDRNARVKLDGASWNASKLAKRIAKHGIWMLIGIATGGAWIFYFADAPSLAAELLTSQAPVAAYVTIALLTATTYTFGGLMREQVCTYMCPWPRIQAAMLDENSLTVTYNDWRGEPRGKYSKKATQTGQRSGDCVDCNACVAVCPMGIDIRDGQQLECITCALCIDACDSVMDKLGRERGLISYATLSDYNSNMAMASRAGRIDPALVRSHGKISDRFRQTDWRSVIRPRTVVYFALWCAIGVGMLLALSSRVPLGLNVLHDRNPQYVLLSDGSIRNGYDVKVLNMTSAPRDVILSIDGLPEATLTSPNLADDPVEELRLAVEPDRVLAIRLYVKLPAGSLEQPEDFSIRVRSADGASEATTSTRFEGPGGK
jgi:cytochrome c oxidase accessory protein FixG